MPVTADDIINHLKKNPGSAQTVKQPEGSAGGPTADDIINASGLKKKDVFSYTQFGATSLGDQSSSTTPNTNATSSDGEINTLPEPPKINPFFTDVKPFSQPFISDHSENNPNFGGQISYDKSLATKQADLENKAMAGDSEATKTILSNKQQAARLRTRYAAGITPQDVQDLKALNDRLDITLSSDEAVRKKMLDEKINTADQQSDKDFSTQRIKFSDNFYGGTLTGEDIALLRTHNPLLPPDGANVNLDKVAQQINNKTANLRTFANAAIAQGAYSYAKTKEDIENDIATKRARIDDIAGTNYVYLDTDGKYKTGDKNFQQQADEANNLLAGIAVSQDKKNFLEQDFYKTVYAPRRDKVVADIVTEIEKDYGKPTEQVFRDANVKGFQPDDILQWGYNNKINSESYQKLKGVVDDYVAKINDPVIKAYHHGTDATVKGDYLDVMNSLKDYLDFVVPAKIAQQDYTDEYKKSAPQAAPILGNIDKIQNYFNTLSSQPFESGLKGSQDAAFLDINKKYQQLLQNSNKYNEIVSKWKAKVDDGSLDAQVASDQIQQELNNTKEIKTIFDNRDQEINKIRNNTNKLREQWIIKGLSDIHPNLVVNPDGSIGVKGVDQNELKTVLDNYTAGAQKVYSATIEQQGKAEGLEADRVNQILADKLGSGGAGLRVGLSDGTNNLGESFFRWLSNKTGVGGDARDWFESKHVQEYNVGEYAKNHYQWKGISSLLDPAYYAYATGQSAPYSVPAILTGLATGGTTTGIILGGLAGGGLETAENALQTYNDLVTNGVNENGLKMTTGEASVAAADDFKKELLPNLVMQTLEFGTLLRTAKDIKPVFNIKAVLAGLKDIGKASLQEAGQEGYQGFIQYNAAEKAKGNNELDIFDYMKTDDFAQNVFGGLAGGLTMGAVLKPTAFNTSVQNWKTLIREGNQEINSNVIYSNALHAEMNGNGATFRDGLRLRLENGSYKNDGEKSDIGKALTYSQGLADVIKKEGIAPNDISGLYAAHNLALSDLYTALSAADEGKTSLSKTYADKAKEYRNVAANTFDGSQKVYYLTDAQDRPVFISDKTANALEQQGSFAKWENSGTIQGVTAINDDEFNNKVQERRNAPPPEHPDAIEARNEVQAHVESWQRQLADNPNESSPIHQVAQEALDKINNNPIAYFTQMRDLITSRPKEQYVDAIEGAQLRKLDRIIKYFISNKPETVQNENVSPEQQLLQAASNELVKNKGGLNEMMQNMVGEKPEQNAPFLKMIADQALNRASTGEQHTTGDPAQARELANNQFGQSVVDAAIQWDAEKNKTITNDNQNIEGVSGESGVGAQSVEAQPVNGPSSEEIGNSGVVQQETPEEIASTKEHDDVIAQVEAHAKDNNISLTPEETDDAAGLYITAHDSGNPITIAQAVDLHNQYKQELTAHERDNIEIEKWLNDSEHHDFVSFDWDGNNLEVFKGRDFAPVEFSRKELEDEGVQLAQPVTEEKSAAIKLAEFFESLKVKGKALSDVTGIGIPAWNLAMDILAKSIRGGVALVNAINDAIKTVREKYNVKLTDDEFKARLQAVADAMNDKPKRLTNEPRIDYANRVLDWRKKMIGTGIEENINTAYSSSQPELDFVKNVNAGAGILNKNIETTNEEFNKQLGLPAKDTDSYIAALKSITATNKNAAKLLNTLRGAAPKVVMMSELRLLRKQFEDFERGYKAGSKDFKEQILGLKKQVNRMIEDYNEAKLFNGIEYSSKEMLKLASMVNKVMTDKSFAKLATFMTNMIDQAEYGRKLLQANQLVKEVKNIAKSKSITQNDVPVLRNLASLNPFDVTNIDQHNTILSDAVQGRNMKAGTRQFTNQQIADYVTNEQNNILLNEANNAATSLSDLMSTNRYLNETNFGTSAPIRDTWATDKIDDILANTQMSFDEKKQAVEKVASAIAQYKALNSKGGGANIDAIYNSIIDPVKNEADESVRLAYETVNKAQQEALDLIDPAVLSDEQKKSVKILRDVNLTGLDSNRLRLFSNVLNNVLDNDDHSGVGMFKAMLGGQQNANPLLQYLKEAGKKFANRALNSKIGKLRFVTLNMSAIVAHITNNNVEMSTKLDNAISLNEMKKGFKAVQDLYINKIKLPLAKIFAANPTLHSDPHSIVRLTLFGFLNQTVQGSNIVEQNEQLQRRIGIIRRDMDIKEREGDKETRSEAINEKAVFDGIRQQILDATGKDIYVDEALKTLTQDDISRIKFLSDGEQQVYDLYKNYHAELQPQHRQIVEYYLNKKYEGWNNYMHDAYRNLNSGLIDVSLADDADLGFSAVQNPNTPSGSTNERVKGDPLAQKPATGQRVLSLHFYNNQDNAINGVLQDIHTLEHRMSSDAAFANRDLKEELGNDNHKLLKTTVTNYVRNAMGLGAQEKEYKVIKKLLNKVAKIGTTRQLLSLTAFIKQSVDTISKTPINLGKDWRMFFQAMGLHYDDNANALIDKNAIGQRKENMAGLNIISTEQLSSLDNIVGEEDKKNIIRRTYDAAAGVLDRFFNHVTKAGVEKEPWIAKPIKTGDFIPAKYAWLAYYGQWRVNHSLDLKFSDIDWAAENANPDKQAEAYAEQMTAKKLNENTRASRSQLINDTGIGNMLLKNILFPFGSFNMHNWNIMLEDARTVFNKQMVIDENYRQDEGYSALKSLMSSIIGETVFQGTKIGINIGLVYPAAHAVLNLFAMLFSSGSDEDKKTLEMMQDALNKSEGKAQDVAWQKWYTESIGNLFFGGFGNGPQLAMEQSVNTLTSSNFFYAPTLSFNQQIQNADNYGMIGAAFSGMGALLKDAYRVFLSPDNRYNEPVKTTALEKIIVSTTMLSEIITMAGRNPAGADLNRIIEKMHDMMDRELTQKYKDPNIQDLEDYFSRPHKLEINGMEAPYSTEQQDFYIQQRGQRLKALESQKIPDQLKMKMANQYAKGMVIQKYPEILQQLKSKPK